MSALDPSSKAGDAALSRRAVLTGVAALTAAAAAGIDLANAPTAHAAVTWHHPFTFRANRPAGGYFGSWQYSSGAPRQYEHTGLDFSGPPSAGEPIRSVAAGTVSEIGWSDSWGNYLYIDHADGYRSGYAHMQSGSIAVAGGQVIGASTVIGRVGNTGADTTGAHLHLVIRHNGTLIDPEPLVRWAPLASTSPIPSVPPLPIGELDMATGFLRDPISGSIFKVESTLGGKVRQLTAQEWWAYFAQGYKTYDVPLAQILALQTANGVGG